MRRLRAVLLGAALACGCRESAPAEPTPASTPPATARADAAPPTHTPEPPPMAPRAPARARQVSVKEASPELADLRAGARFDAPHAFVLPAGAWLTLDFEHGARVRIGGPARVLVELTQQDALLAAAGTLSVDLPPAAPTPESGFMLLTPAGMLSLVRGGRYALRVLEDGATHALVVSGSVTLRAAGASASQASLLLEAGAGFQLLPGGGLKQTRQRAGTLAQAERSMQALRGRSTARLDPARLEALLRSELEATAPLRARQQSLVAEHRAALRARDAGAERMEELQRAIAENAAQLAEARARLRLALGQRAAALQTPAQGGDDAPSQEARALLEL